MIDVEVQHGFPGAGSALRDLEYRYQNEPPSLTLSLARRGGQQKIESVGSRGSGMDIAGVASPVPATHTWSMWSRLPFPASDLGNDH